MAIDLKSMSKIELMELQRKIQTELSDQYNIPKGTGIPTEKLYDVIENKFDPNNTDIVWEVKECIFKICDFSLGNYEQKERFSHSSINGSKTTTTRLKYINAELHEKYSALGTAIVDAIVKYASDKGDKTNGSQVQAQ